MDKKIFKYIRALKLLLATATITSTLAGACSAQDQSQQPSSLYSAAFVWIKDASALREFRKHTLPYVKKNGVKFPIISFPDSFYQTGDVLPGKPDEMRVIQFKSFEHLRSIFSADVFKEANEKHYADAFTNLIGLPSVGPHPTKGENGNYANYLAIGLVYLKDGIKPSAFISSFKKTARKSGMKGASSLTPQMPPATDPPQLILVTSFEDKAAYDHFMTSGAAQHVFDATTARYAFVGGYDVKKPLE